MSTLTLQHRRQRAAEERMAAAKKTFSEAARAALTGDKTAVDQAKTALHEVEATGAEA